MRQVIPRVDPAPSRLSYRFQRLMLTPVYRRLLRVGLPVLVVAGLCAGYLADEARRVALTDQIAEIRRQIETRPEFMVRLMAIDGASESVQADIHEIFPYDLPASSFDLDLPAIRTMLEELPAVAQANVRIRQGGVLAVEIAERQPVALWRTRDGIDVVDIEGESIASVTSRAARPDLPVMTGDGAAAHVAQALDILQAARPLGQDIRGLVRMGERRWDLVLHDGKRILLPEEEPVRALERVIVLNAAHDMLERDLVAIDMRIGARPTVRLSDYATEEWWRITSMTAGAN
ncbi:Cell division protein FtsQ [Roseovarius tolerans]|jgi:cell division protein FtsQ|uniref:Cell division protein FtsQ n=1 Tax=Roseovarius tolerans TaxID=74031 RepID=A0A0L6CVQ4_9RHOB|nr:cell division protein FtsQ/DivIB [Roseovarius tolerans]KNX41553.1 Cell division protein FtsQ [Roseovarius tolerans]